MTKFYIELPDGRQFITLAGNAEHAIARYLSSDAPTIRFAYCVHQGIKSEAVELRSPPAATLFLTWPEQERLLELIDEQLSEDDMTRFICEATGDANRAD